LLKISVKEISIEREPFARGGFGKVYEAKWHDKNVVVKVIKATSEEEEQAVKREANITLRLSHPNVIKLFGITYVKRKRLGIVMEKAEHYSLDKLIGNIDHEKGRNIALGIVDGLEYVHSQKVIHRDIKPQNILLCGPMNDVIPKIADFGVSKVIQTVSVMTHTRGIGQFLYMAPEVLSNSRYTFTADIFSLAMTLFEMMNEQLLTNASPEVYDFVMNVRRGMIGEIPTTCKVPVYLHNIIKRGWNVNPEVRPTLLEYRSTLHGKYTLFLYELFFLM